MRKKVVWLIYDADTAIGINNEGDLVFPYDLEDVDHLPSGADVYNGQDSVMWNNLRQAFFPEIKAMYQDLRSSGALSYAKVEGMFEEHQGRWPEAVFNEDAWFKYIIPLLEDGNATYLSMLQGSKESQRKWWLYNRFKYIDSKYVAGDSMNDLIELRGYARGDITVTPYADIYASIKYGSYLVQERAPRGEGCTLACPMDTLNDTEVMIYSSSQLSSVGDLSPLKVGRANFSNAVRLQSVKLGDADPSYSNGNLTELTLGNNPLLRTLDVRNCPNLQQAVDVSHCTGLEEAYFDGTGIRGLRLPIGGVLKKLHVPASLANLSIRNQPGLTEFVMPSYANVTTLWLEDPSAAVPLMAILSGMGQGARVRLVGAAFEAADTEALGDLYDLLDTFAGLDEDGDNVEGAQVSGTALVGYLNEGQREALEARYPSVVVTAEHTEAWLRYWSEDGTELLHEERVVDGGNGSWAGGSSQTKEPTAQYTYSFSGWALEPGGAVSETALSNVTRDRDVYVCFGASLRTYKVLWKNENGTVLETDAAVPYGTVPTYDGSIPVDPSGKGRTFTGWSPGVAAVTGDVTYMATYPPLLDMLVASLDDGTYASKFSVGDGIPITFDGNTYTGQVVALDTDVDEFDNPIAVSIVFKELLVNRIRMNSWNTNSGGWEASEGRRTVAGFESLLPASVRSRLVAAKKYSTQYVNGDNILEQVTYDRLWIPNVKELDLSNSTGGMRESSGPVYNGVFSNANIRKKSLLGATSTVPYWLRTAYCSNASFFVYDSYSLGDSPHGSYPSGNQAVALGFCLDKLPTYGVEWDYSQSATTLARTGDASGFSDPAPATSLSATGSSPFDNIYPWSEMKMYNVINGEMSYSQDDPGFSYTGYDVVVKIHTFWSKAEKDATNQKWRWSVAGAPTPGYEKHPGSGRYVGRYHASGSSAGVYTKSGAKPLDVTSRTNFRTYIHNKGAKWHMLDLASWSALQMLYLVEYADFDSQSKLGAGWNQPYLGVGACGGTDGAAYHTVKLSQAHNSYRYIEDPFSNVFDLIDGFVGCQNGTYAAVKDGGYAGGSGDLQSLGIALPTTGYIKGFGYSDKAPWAFIPDTSGGAASTYVPDIVYTGGSYAPAIVGGDYRNSADWGFWCLYAYGNDASSGCGTGSRPMYVPGS